MFAEALPLPRPWRELGDDLDHLAVAPDAERQPGAGRLPADDVDDIVGAAHVEPGGAHDVVARFDAGRLRHAVADDAVDARRALALHQLDAEPGPLDRRRLIATGWQREQRIGKGLARALAGGIDRDWNERGHAGHAEIPQLMRRAIAIGDMASPQHGDDRGVG